MFKLRLFFLNWFFKNWFFFFKLINFFCQLFISPCCKNAHRIAHRRFHSTRRRDARPFQSPRHVRSSVEHGARLRTVLGLSHARQISKSELLPLGTSRRDTRSTSTYVTGCEEQWRTIAPRAFSTREDTVNFSRVTVNSNFAGRRSATIYGTFDEFYRNVVDIKESLYPRQIYIWDDREIRWYLSTDRRSKLAPLF